MEASWRTLRRSNGRARAEETRVLGTELRPTGQQMNYRDREPFLMGRGLNARAPPPWGPLIPGDGRPPEGGVVGQFLWGHLTIWRL